VCEGSLADLKQRYGCTESICIDLSQHPGQLAETKLEVEELLGSIAMGEVRCQQVEGSLQLRLPTMDRGRMAALFKALEGLPSLQPVKDESLVRLQVANLHDVFVAATLSNTTWKAAQDGRSRVVPKSSLSTRAADPDGFQPSMEDSASRLTMPLVSNVVTGRSAALLQLQACILKRFNYAKRDLRTFFSMIVLPVLFMCLAMIIAKCKPTSLCLRALVSFS